LLHFLRDGYEYPTGNETSKAVDRYRRRAATNQRRRGNPVEPVER